MVFTGLQHVNFTVGTGPEALELADKFYGEVLGLKSDQGWQSFRCDSQPEEAIQLA